MAHVNECIPGRDATILRGGVPRVVGKAGMIVDVKRVMHTRDQPDVDWVTVDVRGHGAVVVTSEDLDIVVR